MRPGDTQIAVDPHRLFMARKSGMPAEHLLQDLRGRLRLLPAADDGNVAIMLALALIPITLLFGATIDYTQGSRLKAAMQAALDSTALAMAQSAPALTSAALQQQAADNFNALFAGQKVTASKLRRITTLKAPR
jgi:Flp pilus assembly protein TadG